MSLIFGPLEVAAPVVPEGRFARVETSERKFDSYISDLHDLMHIYPQNAGIFPLVVDSPGACERNKNICNGGSE
jgi:hypothetical protein